MKHFFIITNAYKDQDLRLTLDLQNYIRKKGGTCDYYVSLGEGKKDDVVPLSCLPEKLDLIFVVGGDGTLIRAARDTAGTEVPLIGVNRGTLGYLCELEETGITQAIDELLEDRYVIEHRMRLSGHPFQAKEALKQQYALNDIVIHRAGDLQMVNINVSVNGEFLNQFQGDGIIISTPTGSTGYNLSAGGPIVDPKADLILITPINSHTLNARSIVIAGSDEVVVELAARKQDADEQVVVSFDGDHYTTLSVGDRIAIHRAKQGCNICRLSNVSFLEILRKKMQRYN